MGSHLCSILQFVKVGLRWGVVDVLLLLYPQTVKYLYLSFVDSGALLDFYVLSTEGHIMPSHANPVDAHVEEDDYLEVGLFRGGRSCV